jgi:hypothetical protein
LRDVDNMKHRKALFVSIWVIAIGIVLWISGSVVGGVGIIYHAGGWFTPAWYELTWAFYLGVGLVWAGIIAIILGAFGMLTTVLKEYLDREKQKIPPPPPTT